MAFTMKPWVRRIFLLQLLLVLALYGGIMGIRGETLTFQTAFSLFSYALLGGVVVAILALFMLLAPSVRQWGRGRVYVMVTAIAGFLPVCIIVAVVGPANFSVPAIHDITTDTEDPPIFVAALAHRKPSDNTLEYPGDFIARQQQQAYADLKPLDVSLPYIDAYKRSLAIVERSGWQVLDENMETGLIEATATTQMFRFKDDIIIRVRPLRLGSRVDMRSVSRVGISDLGANAARIRHFQQVFLQD